MIYFITDGEFFKVGTAVNLQSRLSTIRGANARQIEVLATCRGGRSLERRIHKALPNRVRLNGEWFGPSAVMDDLISAVNRDGAKAAERFVAEHETAQSPTDWGDFQEQFDAAARGVLSIACAKHSVKQVAAVAGVTAASIRLYLSGKARPGALALSRLGKLEPRLVGLLFGAGSSNRRIAA